MEFGQKEGHYNVPTKHVTASGVWLGLIIQKIVKRRGSEHSEYWAKLENTLTSIEGFELPNRVNKEGVLQKRFEERAHDYQLFIEQHGRSPSTEKAISEAEESLAGWVNTQRTSYKKGQLSEDRVNILESLSFWEWDPDRAQFMQKLGVYREWITEYGTLKVPDKREYGMMNLGSWRGSLKSSRNKHTLPAWKTELLDSLGEWYV